MTKYTKSKRDRQQNRVINDHTRPYNNEERHTLAIRRAIKQYQRDAIAGIEAYYKETM